MTAPEPTPTVEHIDAVARAVCASEFATGFGASEWDEGITNRDRYRENARAILTSTDPAVRLAMLDALVRAGVLTAGLAKFGALPIRPGDSFSGRAG